MLPRMASLAILEPAMKLKELATLSDNLCKPLHKSDEDKLVGGVLIFFFERVASAPLCPGINRLAWCYLQGLPSGMAGEAP